MYEQRAAAALDTVTVGYGGKKETRLEVRFGIVVLTREASSGPVHVAYVPEVPRLLVWGREPDEVRRRARKAIEREIADWYASLVIASEERGEVWLEPLEVDVAESFGGDDEGEESIRPAIDDLTDRAAAGTLERLDRRAPLVERALAALATADAAASVMLVGPGDFGKTTLVAEI